jgi:hypothetical protein
MVNAPFSFVIVASLLLLTLTVALSITYPLSSVTLPVTCHPFCAKATIAKKKVPEKSQLIFRQTLLD